MKFLIKKGHHRAQFAWLKHRPIHLGIQHMKCVINLEKSCHYDWHKMWEDPKTGEMIDYDHWNKLFGFSASFWPKRNSEGKLELPHTLVVACRPALDDSFRYQLGFYLEQDTERVLYWNQMDLGPFDYEQDIVADVGYSLGFARSHSRHIDHPVVKGPGYEGKKIRTTFSPGGYGACGWYMSPYHGGRPPAQHDMRGSITRML